ncbi:MAG: hypothetical protein ACSHX9_15120 [Luteolibacter sp.]
MNAKATITLKKPYYVEMYRDWERYVSKWRRWEVPIGVLLFIAAAVMIFLTG